MKILLLVLLYFISSHLALAQSDALPLNLIQNWEISGGANASFTSSSASDMSAFDVYIISGEADYFVSAQIETGLRTAVTIYSGDSVVATSSYSFLVGMTYNISQKIEESFYLQAWAGLDIFHTININAVSTAHFTYQFDFGKRFPITPNITYRPEFGYNHISSSTHLHSWSFFPLQFSFLF